ncbi:hypothetical protein ACWDA7_38790 [Streptomyces sp. NPDC001156]
MSAELNTRRSWLLKALTAAGQPVRTGDAERLMAESPWPTTGRNTTRKDLRGLARAGLLTKSTDAQGRTSYDPTTSTNTGEPQ